MIYNYTLTMQPYYDHINQCYTNILTLNKEPVGPLKSIVKRLNPPKLSEFNYLSYDNKCCYERKCIYAICNVDDKNEFMCVNDISNLFEYLINNNYIVDKSLTKMFENLSIKLTNPIICFISYKID